MALQMSHTKAAIRDLFDPQPETRPTKSLASPIEEQIRSLRLTHPEWSHKDIGKAVKRASSVVARVLNGAST